MSKRPRDDEEPTANGATGDAAAPAGDASTATDEPDAKRARRDEWTLELSEKTKRTVNPIRAIVDNMKIEPNPDKPKIPLSIGDPTAFGNFSAPKEALAALAERTIAAKHNGYNHSAGTVEARTAVATAFSYPDQGVTVTANDVVIASGCSGALELVFEALCSPGENVVLPRPGFPLYETLAAAHGVDVRHYDLDPTRNWEVDLASLDAVIDINTTAVVLTNPSNPCGASYSAEHLADFLAVIEKHHVIVVADEIYCGMVFSGESYTPLCTLAKDRVPIIHVGGLAKRFMVPGWRVGWAIVYDVDGALENIRNGLYTLSQLIIGANVLTQSAIPDLLLNTSDEYHAANNAALETNAMTVYNKLKDVEGLTPVKPQGAMYVMVGIDTAVLAFDSDVQFSEALFAEQSVMVLPGACFRMPNYFRIVFTAPPDKLAEAVERMAEFCAAHKRV